MKNRFARGSAITDASEMDGEVERERHGKVGSRAVGIAMMPGFGELMRAVRPKQVATAILSRQTTGIRGRTLIVNLSGRPCLIRTCLQAVFPAIPYCLDLIGSLGMQTDPDRCNAFRPLG